jgi:hypothetical protein
MSFGSAARKLLPRDAAGSPPTWHRRRFRLRTCSMQNCERLDADMKSEGYWTYEVLSIEGEKKRSLVISPCDTLAQAMAGAFKDATYYIGVCGYKVALSFHEMCKACNGSGAIGRHTRRAYTERTCKACNGQPSIQVIPETPWQPSEAVKISEVNP